MTRNASCVEDGGSSGAGPVKIGIDLDGEIRDSVAG